MKIVDIKKDKENNKIFYKYIDEDGMEQEKNIFIYNEDGTHTPEVIELYKNYFDKKTNKKSVDTDENVVEESNKDFADEIIKTKEHEIVNEEAKTPLLNAGIAAATVALAMTTIAVIIAACKGCGKQDLDQLNNTTTIESSTDETIEDSTTLDDLMNDSRYTEIKEDKLIQTTLDFIQEYSKHGIELKGEDTLIFAAISNITHLEKTNPELLNKILGDNPDSEQTLTKVGHIIGQIVTLEVTNKDEQVDWTIVLMDETDRKIAQQNISDVIVATKDIAANNEMTNDEKKLAIQEMIQKNYVQPNYDKTVGYNLTDGVHTSLSQEDGADFVTDAIITGILMGDNVLKNYVYGSETFDDIKAISYNEDVVSNIMRMIEECQNVETNENTTSYSR